MGKKEKKKPPVSGKQRRKAANRILGLKKKGRLSDGLKSRFKEYREKRQAKHSDLSNRIEEDWLIDRVFVEANQEQDDYVPLDMKEEFEEPENEKLDSLRSFKKNDEDVELLPLKVDGNVIRRKKQKTDEAPEPVTPVEEAEPEHKNDEKEKESEEDLSQLDPIDRLVRVKELLKQTEQRITNYVKNLTIDPQGQVASLGELVKICAGQKVHSAVRESAQLMATACTAEVFVDIAPSYRIRPLTAEEKQQQMKRETKKLIQFEERIVEYYFNYLTLLEKNAMRLVKTRSTQIREKTFTAEIGLLSTQSLALLLKKLSHFNFNTNLITCMIKISTSSYKPVVKMACEAMEGLFEADVSFRLSLHCVKSIGGLVGSKRHKITPELLYTLLHLKIRNVESRDLDEEKKSLNNHKVNIIKGKKSKTAKKFDKQMKKVEADLKEIEASESLNNKLKTSTEVMKHLFALYFRVLKRMPEPKLMSPVLSGLSKFAHLINVDFFDDLVSTLEELIGKPHLSTLDSLHCVKTMCVVLSGEGKALNIDPIKFYKALYQLLPAIAFQKDLKKQTKEVKLLTECLQYLLNDRKKAVPFNRVVAFVKRVLMMGFLLPPKQLLALLAGVRTNFLAHPKLCTYASFDADYVCNGFYRPDFDDPDYCNAVSTDFVKELQKYLKFPNNYVVTYARHILASVPSSGPDKLAGQWATMRPADWLDNETVKDTPPPFGQSVHVFAQVRSHSTCHGWIQKKSLKLCSKNVFSTVDNWIARDSK